MRISTPVFVACRLTLTLSASHSPSNAASNLALQQSLVQSSRKFNYSGPVNYVTTTADFPLHRIYIIHACSLPLCAIVIKPSCQLAGFELHVPAAFCSNEQCAQVRLCSRRALPRCDPNHDEDEVSVLEPRPAYGRTRKSRDIPRAYCYCICLCHHNLPSYFFTSVQVYTAHLPALHTCTKRMNKLHVHCCHS